MDGPAPAEAGGRRAGKGAGISYRAANRPPVSNQRPPEILDGRHLPGGSRRDTGRRHRREWAGTGAGDAEGRRRVHPTGAGGK